MSECVTINSTLKQFVDHDAAEVYKHVFWSGETPDQNTCIYTLAALTVFHSYALLGNSGKDTGVGGYCMSEY